jgi:hypothetical protein
MKSFFVFDVESVGLHGEGFAVGGGVFLANGAIQWGFRMSCPIDECIGTDEGRKWVKDNCPVLEITHRSPKAMRDAFWEKWSMAKSEGAVMAAECGWPVEANFLGSCITDDPSRQWCGPYPLHEIASFMVAAGMDPMAKYERTSSELPQHDPYADAVQSARLLSEALSKIKI